MRLVIAIGGNALIRAGEDGTWERQLRHGGPIAREGVAMRRAGHELVLTHGNGPQVGALLLQQQLGESEAPALPLDALTAMTQGQLGYLLQTAIARIDARAPPHRPQGPARCPLAARRGRPPRPPLRGADEAGRPVLRRREGAAPG